MSCHQACQAPPEPVPLSASQFVYSKAFPMMLGWTLPCGLVHFPAATLARAFHNDTLHRQSIKNRL